MESNKTDEYFNLLNESLQFGKCLLLDELYKIDRIKSYLNLNVPIHHAPDCVFSNSISVETNSNKKVKHASVGVIIDANNKVLLTRRSSRLNSFPNAWVFPGGHVDQGESYINALLREISEEIGIEIDYINGTFYHKNLEIEIKPIMLYESSSTHSQCLILFYRIQLKDSEHNINLKIQIDEIDAYTWVEYEFLKNILNSDNEMEFEFYGFTYSESDKKFIKHIINHNNFNKLGRYEKIIPYGHYLAFNYL